eukprot:TRINITY_DN16851_c0_g1_i1.p1 TRINITY_DN16851_c0_g1~~TRINITY_DN16851_c0_g1_i1.p1  ORF type:complete len:456 (-),score=117.57 TRINITY_DN16851_c0_g1_i1:7-1374(-)
MRKGFLGGGSKAAAAADDPKKPVPAHIAKLRQELEDAEKELHARRQRRLRDADEKKVTRLTDAASLDSDATTSSKSRSCLSSLDTCALDALASREEKDVTDALHLLAESLMLLLEARQLVDLGDHPLPGRIPWRNLQILLKKRGKEDAGALAAVLSQKPFGQRLAEHIRQRFASVTREKIEAVSADYCTIFDFVDALLLDGSSSGSEVTAADSQAAEPVFLAAAVGEQEREVARLRRKLREAERSEEAARKFAEANAPGGPGQSGYPSEPRQVAAGTATSNGSKTTASEETSHVQSLQYRLNEVEVPPMQEPVLECLLLTALDPRTGSGRVVEVIGRSEDREEPEVAKERAEAVQSWLLDHGVLSENLRLEVEPGGGRSNRRVDLRIQDADGAAVMKKAHEMMSRLLLTDKALTGGDAPADTKTEAAQDVAENAPAQKVPEQASLDSEHGLDDMD